VAAARHEEGRTVRTRWTVCAVRTVRNEEERRHHGDVRQMGATFERVVGDHDVARLEIREAGQHGAHGLAHGAEVHGDMGGVGDQAACAVEDRAGVVEALLDVGRDRGVTQHGAHLLRDGHEAVAEDLEAHRIGHAQVGERGTLGLLLVLEYQDALLAHPRPKAGIDHHGSRVFENEGRARDLAARLEALALVDGRLAAAQHRKPDSLPAQRLRRSGCGLPFAGTRCRHRQARAREGATMRILARAREGAAMRILASARRGRAAAHP